MSVCYMSEINIPMGGAAVIVAVTFCAGLCAARATVKIVRSAARFQQSIVDMILQEDILSAEKDDEYFK